MSELSISNGGGTIRYKVVTIELQIPVHGTGTEGQFIDAAMAPLTEALRKVEHVVAQVSLSRADE